HEKTLNQAYPANEKPSNRQTQSRGTSSGENRSSSGQMKNPAYIATHTEGVNTGNRPARNPGSENDHAVNPLMKPEKQPEANAGTSVAENHTYRANYEEVPVTASLLPLRLPATR